MAVAELPDGTVTFVFTDIEDSTGLVLELGETYGQVIADHRRLVRSAVEDNRGHVVDHGYMWLVPADQKDRVLAELTAGSDAGTVDVKPVEEVLATGLAFDHAELLQAARKRLP